MRAANTFQPIKGANDDDNCNVDDFNENKQTKQKTRLKWLVATTQEQQNVLHSKRKNA